MQYREKVIECLQKAKMVIEIWVPMFEQYNTPAGIDGAIALLKEQEPAEPVMKKGRWFTVPTCMKCGYFFPTGTKPNYCSNCGQAVKWDEDQ